MTPELRYPIPVDFGNVGGIDTRIEAVRGELLSLDATGERVARVLRNTIDQLLDGQNTGRYQWEKLRKTEKTHAGTLVEINLQRELDLRGGRSSSMDYEIAGYEVDCKFSQDLGGWEIPSQAWRDRHICLLLWARDAEAAWTAGLIRASDAYLGAPNQDLKRRLTAEGRTRIRWIWEQRMVLPENLLLTLDPFVVEEIMAGRSGQERINRLFRAAQKHRIGRGVVATVAKKDDFMKRVRANGGARTDLRPQGIVIFGAFSNHQSYARQLGLPVPKDGEFVSVQLALANPTDTRPHIEIEGKRWVVATEEDAVVSAPEIPHHTRGPA